MTQWFRRSPFGADHSSEWNEQWEYRSSATVQTFEVSVRAGKPLDVLALKGIDLNEVIEYADFLKQTAQKLYGKNSDILQLQTCPLCNASLEAAQKELSVFGVPYVRCGRCGHVGVAARPDAKVLDSIFADSELHSSTYIDRNAIETRMKQIISPKLDWCINAFQHRTGQAPVTVLDVGAGGGHFLAGASRHGLIAEGFEKSKASCAFAKEAFDLNLRQDDFLSAHCDPVDIITFWGLLEYVARPRDFIAAAKRVLTPNGLLIVEVPRVDSLGTLVQAMDGAVVARHMDPTTHVNGFSDASLCTALVEEGFAPVAVWYFGMDAYETCVQMALKANNAELFDTFAEFIPVIQQALDRGRQCDDIIIAAVPLERI